MYYGLILGGLFSLNFLMAASNIGILSVLSNFMAIVILFVVYKFTISYRDTTNGGSISYSKAFVYVIMLFFFASIISAAVKFVYFRFFAPDYLSDIFNNTLKIIEEVMPSMPENSYEAIETLTDPLNYSLLSIWGNFTIGFFVALVIAGIAKKESNPFNNKNNNQIEGN